MLWSSPNKQLAQNRRMHSLDLGRAASGDRKLPIADQNAAAPFVKRDVCAGPPRLPAYGLAAGIDESKAEAAPPGEDFSPFVIELTDDDKQSLAQIRRLLPDALKAAKLIERARGAGPDALHDVLVALHQRATKRGSGLEDPPDA